MSPLAPDVAGAESDGLRVVHLYDGHERVRGDGSVPDVVWNNARRVAARGHEVFVVEREWDGTDRTATHEGVTFWRLPLATGATEPWVDLPYEMVGSPTGALRLLADRTNFARAARPLLRALDPDVVHAHLPFAANVLAFDPWVARRTVYTAHLGETDARVVEPLFSPDAFLARRVGATVALNPAMAEAFRDRGVPEERLHVVPNGVDIERFDGVTDADRERVRERYDLRGDVVLFVGTVTPRKGVTTLVAAAGTAFDRVDHEATLVVSGALDLEPAYVDAVRDAADGAGVADRLRLPGFVPEADLLALYDIASVFALPSREEGSSVAVTEAMASGTPIVASRIPGVVQQVDDGVHGRLVPPDDADALADALADLLASPETRDAMAARLDERVTQLSWERVTDRLLDVYAEVAGT